MDLYAAYKAMSIEHGLDLDHVVKYSQLLSIDDIMEGASYLASLKGEELEIGLISAVNYLTSDDSYSVNVIYHIQDSKFMWLLVP